MEYWIKNAQHRNVMGVLWKIRELLKEDAESSGIELEFYALTYDEIDNILDIIEKESKKRFKQ